MNGPPSFTSVLPRTQLQLSDELTYTSYHHNVQPPSMGSVAMARVQLSDELTDASYNNEHAVSLGSVAMAQMQLSDPLTHSETCYNNERAPSMTTVDYRGYSVSEGESLSYNAPPSLSDINVAGRDESEIGPDQMDIDSNWLSLSALIPNPDAFEMPKVYNGNTRNTLALVAEGQRASYKRKKHRDSRITFSSTTEDGHLWRKYGERAILNYKFPRCYFRCAHKAQSGCQAIRQVQQLDDESNMFRISYFGHHTCPPSIR